jgi:hypothetical protein
MTNRDATFRILARCAGVPGNPEVAERLRHDIEGLVRWDDLLQSAEDHGLEPLLLTHLRATGIAIPAEADDRLRARWVQHAHAHAVRTRVVSDVGRAFEVAAIPFLLLKGAALAQLVYQTPLFRPMRDVDLLMREQDAARAQAILRDSGFAPKGIRVPHRHHHLQGMAKTVDGATVTIEVHSRLLRPSPFTRAVRYEDVCDDALPFDWSGHTMHTLSREDMLWHVYLHAFPTDVQCFEIRLISIADLVAATGTWIDELNWDRMERRYGRLLRALPLLDHLTPWPPHVLAKFRTARSHHRIWPAPTDLPAIASSVAGTGPVMNDLFWPPEWWFRLRYGIEGPARWLWYRFAGHPARLAIGAAETLKSRVLNPYPAPPSTPASC